jgi:indolepyruvate ferredoxin oxidoreductase, beta subunit
MPATSTPTPLLPKSLLICALGGEGGGVLTNWLITAARLAGVPAQATSIPGVAQRTGATTYYLEFWPTPSADTGVIFGLNPIPGALDYIISSELLETSRQNTLGMISPDRTHVITSSARALTTGERSEMGDGRIRSNELITHIRAQALHCHVADFSALAREQGTVVSSVLLGAISAAFDLPISEEHYEAAIRGPANTQALNEFNSTSSRSNSNQSSAMQRSLAGFAAGRAAVKPSIAAQEDSTALNPQQRFLLMSLEQIVAEAKHRLTTYQNTEYAALYEARLNRLMAALNWRDSDDLTSKKAQGLRDVARWLALWMAFDDIAQVARIKASQHRFAEVRAEVKASDQEIVKLYEHFKPGIPEVAGYLPPSMAKRLLLWDQQRIANGKEAWAMPIKLGSHSIFGLSLLRLVAAAKRLRPMGERFAQEQAMIEQWLSLLEQAAQRNDSLFASLAQSGRLIKGYGSTNERAKHNLRHVLEHLVTPMLAKAEVNDSMADIISTAIATALKDEAGTQLNRTLAAHGAPTIQPREQVIRFIRKRPA